LFAYSASPAYASAVTATADVPGIAPGDFDTDGDVDQDDFGHLQICFSGSVAQTSPACSDALLDGDADVDADDYEIFQGCMSGANVPADLGCGNFQ
jgi:hypothetical protein